MKNKIILRVSMAMSIALVFIGFIYYSNTHISIWQFNISKNELKDVLINTKDNNYIITNPKLVSELSQEVSNMKKLNKIELNNFPPKEKTMKYTKLMIQTKNNYTYGGSFWKDDNDGIMLDSSGYYWSVSSDLIELIDKSINDSKKL
ncbi:hypothetical protein [Clostridium folliculivorans]|uniref:Uncharacterized protein n=1 Tax=Clostridium folliculivorans TaxID=2886038 RepID=A0A9W6DAD8_9CLOT|nr:hypothetical protein [Clostridium folliculivorans]GKU25109.1 hypothetical protein CFOLD11_19350 [Clostridium folliculivorans]GKU31207.1 hypothetical protein CFB3_33140 [Clostridium folliculivorans]